MGWGTLVYKFLFLSLFSQGCRPSKNENNWDVLPKYASSYKKQRILSFQQKMQIVFLGKM